MSCEDRFTENLRARGYRVTPQRRVILHILLHANRHMTPAQVFAQAQVSLPGLTEPTVYRTLEFLAQSGIAQAAVGMNGRRAFEISDHRHHHLVCRNCARQREIPDEKLASFYAELETSTSYQVVENHLTFFGLCSDCQEK
jgi:Fur family ferric uptake transcriptional regulator